MVCKKMEMVMLLCALVMVFGTLPSEIEEVILLGIPIITRVILQAF